MYAAWKLTNLEYTGTTSLFLQIAFNFLKCLVKRVVKLINKNTTIDEFKVKNKLSFKCFFFFLIKRSHQLMFVGCERKIESESKKGNLKSNSSGCEIGYISITLFGCNICTTEYKP